MLTNIMFSGRASDGRLGTENLEKLKGTQLDEEDRLELLTTQTECSFVFLNAEGWPAGVVMSYFYEGGTFWLTAVEGRNHVKAADRDGRVSIVVSAAGSGLPGRRMVSVRGRVAVHRDRETIDWFLGEFTQRLQPRGPAVLAQTARQPQPGRVRGGPGGQTGQPRPAQDPRQRPRHGRGAGPPLVTGPTDPVNGGQTHR